MANPLCWVFISLKDRKDAKKAMDDLYDPEAKDELGFGRVRDVFSDFFFPGTNTQQTEVKYFVLLPVLYNIIAVKRGYHDAEDYFHGMERKLKTFLVNWWEKNKKKKRYTGIIGKKNPDTYPSDRYQKGLHLWGLSKGSDNEFFSLISDYPYKELSKEERESDPEKDEKIRKFFNPSSLKRLLKNVPQTKKELEEEWKECINGKKKFDFYHLNKMEKEYILKGMENGVKDSLIWCFTKDPKKYYKMIKNKNRRYVWGFDELDYKLVKSVDKDIKNKPYSYQKLLSANRSFCLLAYGIYQWYHFFLLKEWIDTNAEDKEWCNDQLQEVLKNIRRWNDKKKKLDKKDLEILSDVALNIRREVEKKYKIRHDKDELNKVITFIKSFYEDYEQRILLKEAESMVRGPKKTKENQELNKLKDHIRGQERHLKKLDDTKEGRDNLMRWIRDRKTKNESEKLKLTDEGTDQEELPQEVEDNTFYYDSKRFLVIKKYLHAMAKGKS